MGAEDIREAYLEITSKCNLRCNHCYGSFGAGTKEELSTAEWFNIIRKLKSAGVRDCILLGGEPTLKENFYKILQYAIDNFDNVVVETNGTTRTDLSDFECTVSVSLESCFPGKNSSIRHGKVTDDNPEGLVYSEHFDEWMSAYELAIRKLRGLTNPKIIRFTLYQDTDVISSILLAERVDATAVFVPLVATGRGSSLEHQVPNAKKIRDSYEQVFLMNHKTKSKHIIQHPQYFLWDKYALLKVKDKLIKRGRICSAGQHRIFIDTKGRAFPCPFLVYKQFFAGFAHKEDIKLIYNNLDKFNEWVDSVTAIGKCANCVAYKICNGGGVCNWIQDRYKQGINCPMNLNQEVIKR